VALALGLGVALALDLVEDRSADLHRVARAAQANVHDLDAVLLPTLRHAREQLVMDLFHAAIYLVLIGADEVIEALLPDDGRQLGLDLVRKDSMCHLRRADAADEDVHRLFSGDAPTHISADRDVPVDAGGGDAVLVRAILVAFLDPVQE